MGIWVCASMWPFTSVCTRSTQPFGWPFNLISCTSATGWTSIITDTVRSYGIFWFFVRQPYYDVLDLAHGKSLWTHGRAYTRKTCKKKKKKSNARRIRLVKFAKWMSRGCREDVER